MYESWWYSQASTLHRAGDKAWRPQRLAHDQGPVWTLDPRKCHPRCTHWGYTPLGWGWGRGSLSSAFITTFHDCSLPGPPPPYLLGGRGPPPTPARWPWEGGWEGRAVCFVQHPLANQRRKHTCWSRIPETPPSLVACWSGAHWGLRLLTVCSSDIAGGALGIPWRQHGL